MRINAHPYVPLSEGKNGHMKARYERSSNENDQVVWLDEEDTQIEDAPKNEKRDYGNPVSHLYARTAQAAPA
jgi:hypothetical protein